MRAVKALTERLHEHKAAAQATEDRAATALQLAARVGDERDKLARERAAVDADCDAARRALADRERDEREALSVADARRRRGRV